MTVYWPGVIVCLVAVAAGLIVWWQVLTLDDEPPADDVKTMILLRHGDDLYEVDDIWDALRVARILARLDSERDAA